jgi:hypothetical protein
VAGVRIVRVNDISRSAVCCHARHHHLGHVFRRPHSVVAT